MSDAVMSPWAEASTHPRVAVPYYRRSAPPRSPSGAIYRLIEDACLLVAAAFGLVFFATLLGLGL